MNTYETAVAYVRAGLGVLPVRRDGTKAPALKAGHPYLKQRPTLADLARWFDTPTPLGIGIPGGAVSGNMETLDFESVSIHSLWFELIDQRLPGLVERLSWCLTPGHIDGSRGLHARYRVGGGFVVPGSTTLAQEIDEEESAKQGKPIWRTLIETRGQGGYAVAPGTPCECAESRRLWEHLGGPPLTEPPTIMPDERNALVDCARLLTRKIAARRGPPDGPTLGDEYDRKTPWSAVLQPHGWKIVRESEGVTYWLRPGKDGGTWSATTGYCVNNGIPLLKVFTSNANPLEMGGVYGPFRAYATLNHGGDQAEAARAISGKQPKGRGKASGEKEMPPDDPAKEETETVSYPASEVVPVKVRWLWPGRIPLAHLTTFAGSGGLGKTFALCDATARVTTGKDWPDGSPGSPPAGVLFISGEDSPEDTLVPRMIELGADLTLVRFLNKKALARFTLAHLPMLGKALSESVVPIRLVVIDPPTAYLADVDDHKNSELRKILTPLAEWSEEYDCSVVFNTHVNKGGSGNLDAMARVMGSVAWVNVVRAAHLFAKDPDDPMRCVFVPMKNNLGPKKKGLGYRVLDLGDYRGTLEWLGEIDTTADEAVATPTKKKTRDEKAGEWLVERFREKLEWRSDDLFRAAKQCGVSRSALFEAKDSLALPKARKVTGQNGDEAWWWWVPADWPSLARPCSPGQVF